MKAAGVERYNPSDRCGSQKLPLRDLNHIQWDVTRDGKRFLFLIPAPETVPVPFTVVLNWQAALLP